MRTHPAPIPADESEHALGCDCGCVCGHPGASLTLLAVSAAIGFVLVTGKLAFAVVYSAITDPARTRGFLGL